MRFRAIVLSVLAHSALLGAIAWHYLSPRPLAALEIQAPLGDVFVEEQRGLPSPVAANAVPAPIADLGEAPVVDPAVSGGGTLSRVGLTTGEAKPVGEIRPGYPPVSRKLGEEGEAVFVLRISPSGQVEEASLEKSSGHDRLDAAAKTALLGARFQNENGTALVKQFRVEFRLKAAR
jgi:protein TonB